MPFSGGGGGGGAASSQPGFEIGYDQITANVNVVSTTEATGTTIITCAAHTFDGGPVLATFFGRLKTPSVAAQAVTVCLFEGATEISQLATVVSPAAANNSTSLTAILRFTPTAATHTYTVTAFATSTTGTPAVTAGAGGTGAEAPAFIRFTKV